MVGQVREKKGKQADKWKHEMSAVQSPETSIEGKYLSSSDVKEP